MRFRSRADIPSRFCLSSVVTRREHQLLPAMVCTSVVLPALLGLMMAVMDPCSALRVTPRMMLLRPYLLVRFSTSSSDMTRPR